MGPSGLDVTWHESFFPSVVISSLPQHPGFDKPLRCFCYLLEFDNPCFQVNCLQWDTSIYQRASSLVLGGNSYYLQNAGSIAHLGDFHINFKSLFCVLVASRVWHVEPGVCVYMCVCLCVLIYIYICWGLKASWTLDAVVIVYFILVVWKGDEVADVKMPLSSCLVGRSTL